MSLDVKINGLAELDKLLAELPDKLQRNVLRSALRAGAKVIEERAKEQLQDDGSVLTGRLRDSIHASVRLRRGKPVATIKAGGTGKGDAFYARWVEFGTAPHDIKPRKHKSLFFAGLARDVVHHPGAKKHPFMRPALDTATAAATLAFALQVKKRLTKQGLDTPDDVSIDTSGDTATP
jgi:HK97 gp10 family phage protein